MFFGPLISSIVTSTAGVLIAAKEEQDRIDAMPEPLRMIAIAARKKRWDEVKAHQDALEIANAGRARNFWGD